MQRVATRTDGQANAMMGPLNKATSVVMLFGVLTLAAIGGPLIHLLYGRAFSSAFPALLILLPGTWAISLWKNIIYDLAARGYPGVKLSGAGIAIVLTIMLDVICIPRWGIVGAALASSVAYSSAFAAALWFYCRITSCHPGDVLVPKVNDLIVICEKMRDFLLPRPVTKQAPTKPGQL
jgi:O-antigen/teichoic acid export membrane protein